MSRSYNRHGWKGFANAGNMKFFKRRGHKRIRHSEINEDSTTMSKNEASNMYDAPCQKVFFGDNYFDNETKEVFKRK